MRRDEALERAGWAAKDWVRPAGICITTLYTMPAAKRPKSIKIGGRRLIIESPKEWLARLAQEEAAEAAQRAIQAQADVALAGVAR